MSILLIFNDMLKNSVGTVVQWSAPSPHSKRVVGLIPTRRLSLWSLHVVGKSKLSMAVHMSMDGCLSSCVGPAVNLQLVQGVLCLHPKIAGIDSSRPVTLSAG